MDRKDICINLLKKGLITDEEFKILYDEKVETIQWWREFPQQPMPLPQPHVKTPDIWHGINDPLTGTPLPPMWSTPYTGDPPIERPIGAYYGEPPKTILLSNNFC